MSRRPVHPQLLTALCYAAMMALSIGINLLPVYLTTISGVFGGAHGLTQEQLGRLGASVFAGLVIGILITGPLADRLGAKLFTLVASALIALALAAAALARDYAALTVALFFLGAGSGIMDMVLSPIVAVLNPARRTAALNWLHSFYCVGAVVTILAGTLFIKAGVSWGGACWLLLPLPAVLFALFLPLRFPALAAGGERARLRTLLRKKWFVLALGAIFLGGATEAGMAQWLPAYAETRLNFSLTVSGGAFLAFSLMMALGRMLVGALGKCADEYSLMGWGCALSAALFLGGSFLPWPAAALTACVLVGFTGSCLWPTTLAVCANRYPAGGASMFGLLAALGNAGGIFMPWVVGWAADCANLAWGLALSALAPALMLPLLVLMRRPAAR
ncbi:MAG: MFS transporter [Verrucomicrobiales bacterium]|jgi:fucose permease|nr:MFS transporter [Verrucomicrobiales bacterium]